MQHKAAKPSGKSRHAIAAGVVAIVAVVAAVSAGIITDSSTSRSYEEDFEGFLSGQTPSDTWYSVTTTGSGIQQVFQPAPTGMGNLAWRIDDTTVGYAAQISNTGSGVNACTAGQTFQFQFATTGTIGLGTSQEFRISAGAVSGATSPINSVGVLVSGQVGLENIVSYVNGNTGGVAVISHTAVYLSGDVVNVAITAVNCAGSASAIITYTGGVTFSDTVTATGPIVGVLNKFSVASTGTLASTGYSWADSLGWHGVPLPPPVITTVAPNNGPASGGTVVTISGTGFWPGTGLYSAGAGCTPKPTIIWGGVTQTAAQVTCANDGFGNVDRTKIIFTTPAHAAGQVGVTVRNPDLQASTCNNCFTYGQNPVPVITSLAPNSGGNAGGETITVNGMNYQTGATVTFGSVPGQGVVFVSSGQLTVTAPPQTNVAVGVTVTNPDTQISNAVCYSYGTADCSQGPGGGGGGGALIEDFEPFAVGGIPARSYYTYTSVGSNINVQLCSLQGLTSGTKCLRQPSATTATYTGLFDLCESGITFSIVRSSSGLWVQSRMTTTSTFDTSLETTLIDVKQTGAGNNYQLQVGRFGSTDLTADFVPALNNAAGDKLTFTVSPCGNTILAVESTTGASASVSGLTTGALKPFNRFFIANAVGSTFDVDDINFGSPAGGGVTGPGVLVAHVDVTGLVGFDADSFNNVVIARHDDCQMGDQCVRTYNPTTLGTLATFNLDGGCDGHFDGVGGYTGPNGYYTTFYNCAPDGKTDRLHIRDSLFEAPNQGGTTCTDFCNIDFSEEGAFSNGACNTPFGVQNQPLPERLRHLGKLAVAAWDFSNDGTNPDHSTVSWSFTNTETGEIGVFAITQNDGERDCAGISAQTLSPTDETQDMCSFQDWVHGKTGIVGAALDGPTKAYNADINVLEAQHFGSGAGFYYPEISFLQAGQAAISYQNLRGLDCATERWGVCQPFANPCPQANQKIVYTKTVALLQKEGGDVAAVTPIADPNNVGWSEKWSKQDGFGSDYHAVAVSGDGRWAAYLTGTTFNIVNMTNGEFRGDVTRSPGVCCRGMEMDDTGQTLWVAAGTYIDKFDIHNLTTGVVVPPGTTLIYDGSGTGNTTGAVCNNSFGGPTATGECDNTVDPISVQTPGGQPGTPTPTPGSSIAGALPGCGFGFNIFGMNAVQTMAIFTTIMIVGFIVAAYLISKRKNSDGTLSGAIIVMLATIAYVLSMFLWCAPVWSIAVLVVLGIVFTFIMSRSGASA